MGDRMFKQMRFRLTLLFTSLMVFFLISFIAISYIVGSALIMTKQEQQVVALAEEEYREHRSELLYSHSRSYGMRTKRNTIDYRAEIPMFYYVVTKDGKIINGDESLPEIRNQLIRFIADWIPKDGEVRRETINMDDGTTISFLLSGKPVFQDGVHVGTIYTGTNITTQMDIMKVLVIALGIISILFIGLSIWLGYYMSGKAMIPIVNAFQRQKDFVTNASHELRTPLSILQSSIEVIEAEEREKLSNFSLQIFHDMKDELKRMTKLIYDLLLLARFDANTISLTKEKFALAPIIDEWMRKCRMLTEEKNITCDANVREHVTIYGDKERIAQLLFILLDNAIKYNVENGKITITVRDDKSKVEIEVSDTGIGIPPEHQPFIFERFYRVDQSRSRNQQGNGIGLSIAKWIVDAHHGTITVESKVGEGSRFVITLPQIHA